eukprot:UN4913
MVLALNVSVYFCKLLPLHMNGNLPVGIGMHVFAMICDLMSSDCMRVGARASRAAMLCVHQRPSEASCRGRVFEFTPVATHIHKARRTLPPTLGTAVFWYEH